jgi:hypothetical protein
MATESDLQKTENLSARLATRDDLLTREDLLVLVKSGEELADRRCGLPAISYYVPENT